MHMYMIDCGETIFALGDNVRWDRPPTSGGFSSGEGRDAITCVWIDCKNGATTDITSLWTKGGKLNYCARVIRLDMTAPLSLMKLEGHGI